MHLENQASTSASPWTLRSSNLLNKSAKNYDSWRPILHISIVSVRWAKWQHHWHTRSSSPLLPPSPAPTVALNGCHTTLPILIEPVRQQPESISTGIVRLRLSIVSVRST